MKKTLCMLLTIFLIIVAITACSSGSANAPAATDSNTSSSAGKVDTSKKQVYAMVSFLSAQDHFVRCWNGFKKACDYLGVEAIHLAKTENDLAAYLQNVQTAINMGVSGIAVACQNADAYIDVINQAIDAGIPVVTFDSDSPNSKRLSYLSTGNYEAGEAAAKFLAEKIGGEGEICFINRPGQENIESRCQGFQDYMAANYPKIQVFVVGVEAGVEAAAAGAASAIQAHPNLKAFMAGGGTQGTAAITSVKELGLQDKIITLCFDLNQDTLEAVKKSEAVGTIMQGTYNMGWYSAQFLYNYANKLIGEGAGGGYLPPRVDTGVVVVTPENYDKYIK